MGLAEAELVLEPYAKTKESAACAAFVHFSPTLRNDSREALALWREDNPKSTGVKAYGPCPQACFLLHCHFG